VAKLTFDDGTEIGFLEDGDELVMEAWCGSEEGGADIAIGFGECRGVIFPASTS
jgi:fumarylacetoacetase